MGNTLHPFVLGLQHVTRDPGRGNENKKQDHQNVLQHICVCTELCSLTLTLTPGLVDDYHGGGKPFGCSAAKKNLPLMLGEEGGGGGKAQDNQDLCAHFTFCSTPC